MVVSSTLIVKQGKFVKMQSVWKVAGVHHHDYLNHDHDYKSFKGHSFMMLLLRTTMHPQWKPNIKISLANKPIKGGHGMFWVGLRMPVRSGELQILPKPTMRSRWSIVMVDEDHAAQNYRTEIE